MKILFDTNVVLDILLSREPFVHDSFSCLEKMIAKGERLFLSSSSATDVFYLVRKARKSKEIALDSIRRLSYIFDFATVEENAILVALTSQMNDYEDAVVDEVAQRIKADYIITRNAKDFIKAKTKTITPSDYLKLT